mmetsp:Transcript_16625/g.52018  ORF Transcript_16625/g.52018 Transcript_16625/m.52018 type:complete len:231 (+) Transcript_16625:360-1052(+)|eukprot:CAMPEP_0197402134 /NCGR_PEP_ID=MMETSP1165-20131217/19603_1 /TAXON_ID=284809 /ORGANISM="Chrysocystis fragilis, Strain CCMP3189" /LENGTH=230 /DNA_ID=CAMNT_0042928273 /DNA_START=52 /DNA_END=744 /DNA_ORIENTATION=+
MAGSGLLVLVVAHVGLGFQRAIVTRQARQVVFSDGGVKYDAGSGWKPDQGGMQSTDTPDFFYEDGDDRNPSIEYTDGIMGSTGLDKLKAASRSSDPGVAGALDVDPTRIGGYQAASAEAKGVKFEVSGPITQEVTISMPAQSDSPRIEDVFIKPVCMAYEDFYAGFTADTPSCFSVTPTEGRMDRRGGDPTVLTVQVKADGQVGQKVGTLCVVLPDEGEQFNVKVTANFS